MNTIAIMLGGFLGAICRYTLGEWVHTGEGFPVGTLFINVSGCFFFGAFFTYVALKSLRWRSFVLFIGTGFLGSFTTFATFSVEAVVLYERGMVWQAVGYIFLSIALGVLAAAGGRKLVYVWCCEKGETG